MVWDLVHAMRAAPEGRAAGGSKYDPLFALLEQSRLEQVRGPSWAVGQEKAEGVCMYVWCICVPRVCVWCVWEEVQFRHGSAAQPACQDLEGRDSPPQSAARPLPGPLHAGVGPWQAGPAAGPVPVGPCCRLGRAGAL